ncbi:23S rRNA (adenine(1618)-N(6))-methyltransferase RlmF [Chitinimonas arctica]|uniref:Ribosomal RNA large subunit methyltransferase F n=1 Tax=Chitinimonas arctica TaxID=2594795 RepID=A0A516SFV7_9NEIS|nr:23S rRNA (adenine(1618)-N(6))-methyltransferase RlmF [Chitinimonas arctica]QDQ26908.1 23S rRNA (adenine(1618)-N(6))-methyltransferase RlmF [Chitinimonas arctica]
MRPSQRKASAPAPRSVPAEKTGLHPRNAHRARYDFPRLLAVSPELAAYAAKNVHGDVSVDFADPAAVKALNRALLQLHYGIAQWDIPPQYLCPPIPGRADYLHYVADLLADCKGGGVPRGDTVQVLDIGVGANCIYPIIGRHEYGWRFVGTDIDTQALASAQAIVDGNPGLRGGVELRLQASPTAILDGVLLDQEWFDLCICNPPFHASEQEATASTQRKWRNLGKDKAGGNSPVLNFGGQAGELWCEGGEEAFILRMVEESSRQPTRCFWFTTLVSKAASLPAIYRALEQVGVWDSRTMEMTQGQKQSRIVAWTFCDERQQNAWRVLRREQAGQR